VLRAQGREGVSIGGKDENAEYVSKKSSPFLSSCIFPILNHLLYPPLLLTNISTLTSRRTPPRTSSGPPSRRHPRRPSLHPRRRLRPARVAGPPRPAVGPRPLGSPRSPRKRTPAAAAAPLPRPAKCNRRRRPAAAAKRRGRCGAREEARCRKGGR
jgi:hypothetical protein